MSIASRNLYLPSFLIVTKVNSLFTISQSRKKDLDDSVYDDKVDTPNPGFLDNRNDGNLVNNPIPIANLGAG